MRPHTPTEITVMIFGSESLNEMVWPDLSLQPLPERKRRGCGDLHWVQTNIGW